MMTRTLDDRHHLLRQDAQLVQIVDAAFADAARRSGEHLVCRPGCTQCCHGAFAIGPLDALRLRAGMTELTATDPVRASAVAERARAYLAEFGPSFPGDPKTGILSTDEDAQEAFDDFANDAACPALDPFTGLCDLYSARPMTCRVFGPPVKMRPEAEPDSAAEEGLAVCELCFTHATPEEVLAGEMKVPHEEEATVLAELQAIQPGSVGETIVAFCLVPSTAS